MQLIGCRAAGKGHSRRGKVKGVSRVSVAEPCFDAERVLNLQVKQVLPNVKTEGWRW